MGEREISFFRPIYYLGCKNRFISTIESAIKDVDPDGGHVCDLFSGSGVVAASLSQSRQVTAVDIQEYSRVLSSALMSPHLLTSDLRLSIVTEVRRVLHSSAVANYLRALIEYENTCIEDAIRNDSSGLIELLEAPPIESISAYTDSVNSHFTHLRNELVEKLRMEEKWETVDTVILRHFGGIYFSYEQAMVLDTILKVIEQQPPSAKDTLTAAVLSTASSLVNTVGKQFAQPIRPRNKDGTVKVGAIKLAKRDRTLDTLEVFSAWLERYGNLPRSQFPSVALRDDYAEALKKHGRDFTVVYADPPYTRDHYSRFYHVLETISLRDNPVISKVVKKGRIESSRGHYREQRHQSPFCIRSTAPTAFDSLFRMARESNLGLVLSYSPHEAGDGTHPRVVSTSQIIELAYQHYRKVLVRQVDGASHNQLNRTDLKLQSRKEAEIIIQCFR